ncbi:MAG: sugar phosphate nucleotidyltransferase, partial [Balneolaceae bacterium]
MKSSVIAIILGGGRGTRLHPLTKYRSKPAVPIAGKYRLVDIPISNCMNSGIRRMFVLTQFNSASLNRHIKNTYNFDVFSSGFVDILAAEQTPKSQNWFQGTADAVRQSLHHLRNHKYEHVLILSGDQLYQMDYRKM